MKTILTLLIVLSFHISAQAQDPEQLETHELENTGKPAQEMTLVGPNSGKTFHVEDPKAKKKHSGKKSKKTEKEKKTGE